MAPADTESRGALSWMTQNSVAANLLAIVIVIGGLLVAFRVKQEVFPEFDLDIVLIEVPYPGASPAEVEQGIIFAIEEAVRGLDGVKRVTANALEGNGSVLIELLLGTNPNKALQDVKNAVDRIRSFPEDAERPLVNLLTNRQEVISFIIYGDLDEGALRALAEHAREELLQNPGITQVELSGVRPLEIGIEIPQATLRAYNLTPEAVAQQVARGAVELPGGGVKTRGGEVLLRTAERRDLGREFADIVLLSNVEGGDVRLGDIAQIHDGFEDTDERAFFNGKRAVRVDVFRVGDQTPLEVAAIAKDYSRRFRSQLPPGVQVATWLDWSEMLSDRLSLLLRNASLGLVLVLLILSLFLQPHLAGWVTLGIPVSVLGGIFLMPLLGVSINMISLFAFILTLGIIVDDAIVVGENVYEERQRGAPPLAAAIRGVQGMGIPVTFSVLTNIVAFVPLLAIPGTMGKFMRVIPLVVIPVLVVSLIESLYVLPAHLGHHEPRGERGPLAALDRRQRRIANALEHVIRDVYRPWLDVAMRSRYVTAALGAAALILTVGYVMSGRIGFTFMPRVDTDIITASAVLPYGTAMEEAEAVHDRLVAAARDVMEANGGDAISRGLFTQIGRSLGRFGPRGGGIAQTGSHLVGAQAYLVPSDEREITSPRFAREWSDRIGNIAGLESLTFEYSTGPSAQADINIELSHPSTAVLERAAGELAAALATFAGVTGIDDGFAPGKMQLDFKIRSEARSLGITASDLGRQIRSAFYGAEAIRQQRGRNEMKVMVRLPEGERKSEYNVETLLIRTPDGGEIPLVEAADIERGRAYTEIKRADGRRVVNVTAEVVPGVANPGKVLNDLKKDFLPGLLNRYSGLRYALEGMQREQRESLQSLGLGFLLVLLVMFGLLAVVFRSYVQPVIVMTAIPFGIVGAVIGHLIMGFELSLISMMGIVALSGVVVNDSLVLIHEANRRRQAGEDALEGIIGAGVRRFRPILLTSLTTFFGLLPMIFEPSVQARFLVPMAISLGYGILFSTAIVLFLVPALYLIVDDVHRFGEAHSRVVAPADS